MAAYPNLFRLLRKTHLYVGLFISPSLLFFAFTGAVQTLSLHEAAGTDYQPPALLESLGHLHKDQTPVIPPRRKPPSAAPEAAGGGAMAATAAPAPPAKPPVTLASKQKQHLPMKIFFLVVSLGLFTSTLTGIYMAYKYERGKLVVTGLLLLGVMLPIFLARP